MEEQELRRELLFFSLSKWPDLETAIEMAARMERFILEGAEANRRDEIDPDAAAEGGDGKPSEHQTTCSEVAALGAAPSGAVSRSASAGPTGGQKRRWSAADDDSLRRLWHSSQPMESIAEELGRTTPSLYCRARALGLSKRAANSRTSAGSASTEHDPLAAPQTTSVALEQCRAPLRNGSMRSGRARSGNDQGTTPAHLNRETARSTLQAQPDRCIEPDIQFLRSRDYSVVRVEGGRYQLDGRRILSASELRKKANQVRQALGQRPFAAQQAEPLR